MKKEKRTTTSCVTKRAGFMISDTGGLEAQEGIARGVDLVLSGVLETQAEEFVEVYEIVEMRFYLFYVDCSYSCSFWWSFCTTWCV